MPDAPAPTYDSHGQPVGHWSIAIGYDPVSDRIHVHRACPAGPYHNAVNEVEAFEPQDLEDAIASVQRHARVLGARRLF